MSTGFSDSSIVLSALNTYKAAVLAALKAIKAKGDTKEGKGICKLVADHGVIFGQFLQVDHCHLKSWPEFSGYTGYPVPFKSLKYSPVAAFGRLKKWSKHSAYGQARWRLLDHLIECYEKELGL